MAARTTRRKIVWHLNSACDHCDRIMRHLQQVGDFSAGRIPPVEESLPELVEAVVLIRGGLQSLRNRI